MSQSRMKVVDFSIAGDAITNPHLGYTTKGKFQFSDKLAESLQSNKIKRYSKNTNVS